MDRDTEIRKATSHLSGEARRDAINYLAAHPAMLRKFGPIKIRKYMQSPLKDRPKRDKHLVNYSLWLTPEQYLKLKRRAELCDLSMAGLIRKCCCD